jgi:hypothetical protein
MLTLLNSILNKLKILFGITRETANPAIDRVVAIHEAGHAAARVIVAETLGWRPEEALVFIDIRAAPIAMGSSSDGVHELASQATTYGQFLSRPMTEFMQPKMRSQGFAGFTREDFAEMQAAGIDIAEWFKAKSVECLFGPMAERKFLGKPLQDLFQDDSAEADIREILLNGALCGMTHEQIVESLNRNFAVCERIMSHPKMWAAIVALADALKPGRTDGYDAATILVRELWGRQLPAKPS